MNRKTPTPRCLSRQHPELANRSPAPRGPLGGVVNPARNQALPPVQGALDGASRKGL